MSEEEDGRGGGGGYRTKNKNPTHQCGDKTAERAVCRVDFPDM